MVTFAIIWTIATMLISFTVGYAHGTRHMRSGRTFEAPLPKVTRREHLGFGGTLHRMRIADDGSVQPK